MKEYRRRFIQMSMLLIGIVLAVLLIVLFFFVQTDQYNNLKWTMREMLEPLSRQDPAELPEGAEKSRFVTVFVGEEGIEDISIFDLSADYNEDTLNDVVNEVLSSTDSFGTIEAYDVIYYRREMGTGYKIAMVDKDYMIDSMRHFVILFVVVWGCAMLLFFCISRIFARSAVYPLECARIRETQFVADVSHDLKTPLAIIMANNSILLNAPDKQVSDCQKWIVGCQEAAENMRALLNQMLELYVADATDISLFFCPSDLSDIVQRVAIQMEVIAWERSVKLVSDIQNSVVVIGDREAFMRIITILIDNALMYETLGGTVLVRVFTEHKCANVSVHNNTVIPDSDLPHIFERYYRSAKAHRKSGEGLGLSIAQKLVEKMGGSLVCVSSPEYGTTFTMRFRHRLKYP